MNANDFQAGVILAFAVMAVASGIFLFGFLVGRAVYS